MWRAGKIFLINPLNPGGSCSSARRQLHIKTEVTAVLRSLPSVTESLERTPYYDYTQTEWSVFLSDSSKRRGWFWFDYSPRSACCSDTAIFKYSLRCLIYKEPKNLALTCEVLIDFSICFISSRQIDLAWHKCVDTESFGNVDSNHNDRCFFFGYLIAYIFLNHRIFILQSKDSKIPRPTENRIIWRCYNSISS